MSDNYNIESHKLFWHMNRVNEWMKGSRIAPLSIDMGITQDCNLKCKYCYYAVSENKSNNKITTDALIRLIHDCSEMNIKSISFAGDGEPMIHPGVYDAVIEGAGNGIDMAISTNGLTIKENRVEDFLASLTWIRFSISAASPEVFECVMGGTKKKYEIIIDNNKKRVEIKEKLNLNVTIGIQMVLIPENVEDIVQYAYLGKELGVDYCVIKQCSESADIKIRRIIDNQAELESLLRKAERCSDQYYHVIIKRKKMRNTIRQYEKCFGYEFLSQISGAGEVYPCGNFYGKKKFCAGNINNERFKDIIFGDRYQSIMERVKKDIDVHQSCGYACRVNEINEFLWKLKHPPKHINFI